MSPFQLSFDRPYPAIANRLQGVRILVVEDEFLIALEMEELLTDLGCNVIATVPEFGGALQAVERGGFDLAILDINVTDANSYPVADRLLELGVPFLFGTGYTVKRLPKRFRHLPFVQKPIDVNELRERLIDCLDPDD